LVVPSVALAAGCVDIWTTTMDGDEAGDLEADFGLLSPEERAQVVASAPKVRARRTRSRAFLRRVLSAYLAVPAADLTISTECLQCGDPQHGKPSLSAPDRAFLPRFSVSHSGGCQIVAVSDREVGVDVERRLPLPDLDLLVQTILAPDVADGLLSLPRPERLRSFYREWTKREACLKGAGLGLAADPKDLTFEPARAEARFERSRVPSLAETWSVTMLDLGPEYTGALAVEGPPVRLRTLDQGWLEIGVLVSSSARAVRSVRAARGSGAS
jgi:4'-phosphopantetheinyl transferase